MYLYYWRCLPHCIRAPQPVGPSITSWLHLDQTKSVHGIVRTAAPVLVVAYLGHAGGILIILQSTPTLRGHSRHQMVVGYTGAAT